MSLLFKRLLILLPLLMAGCAAAPPYAALDKYVVESMAKTGTQGIAIAVIDNGAVSHVQSWGRRNARGEPLRTDTVMYGASLTKAVFAYTVMQLADEGKINLDASIATYLAAASFKLCGRREKIRCVAASQRR